MTIPHGLTSCVVDRKKKKTGKSSLLATGALSQSISAHLSRPIIILFSVCPIVSRNAHAMYWDTVESGRTFPVVVHNNFARGHNTKLQRFRKSNLWLLDQRRQPPRIPRLSFLGPASKGLSHS